MYRDGEEVPAGSRIGQTGSEAEILTTFVEKVRRYGTDVITGYNIGGYDLPLLKERFEALKLPRLALGRDWSEPDDAGGDRLWKVHGRVFADAW